jgi:hypothetical protein
MTGSTTAVDSKLFVRISGSWISTPHSEIDQCRCGCEDTSVIPSEDVDKREEMRGAEGLGHKVLSLEVAKTLRKSQRRGFLKIIQVTLEGRNAGMMMLSGLRQSSSGEGEWE